MNQIHKIKEQEVRKGFKGIARYGELVNLVEEVSVVSFDFFDTLFTRPLSNPEDAFDIIGLRFGISDFRERRRAAQAEAFRQMISEGRKEITLGDIYACYVETSVPRSELMNAEYSLELSLVEPIPEMLEFFRDLLSSGKRVVVTSDMYLSKGFFQEVLKPYELEQVPLFISADCNATKRDTGELFQVVAQEMGLPAKEILHIGDNHMADVQRAQEMGLRAFHYEPTAQWAVGKTQSLATSIGYGLLQRRAVDIQPNSFRELGYVYGGSATVGFLEWIKERASRDGIDQLLFLSRDGYALDQIARLESSARMPSYTYFLGSRVAYMLAAIKEDSFQQYIPFLLSGADGLNPSELLERIGVPAPSEKVMADLGLGEGIRVNSSIYDSLARFLYAYRWEILKVCQRNRKALYQHLLSLGLSSGKRVALVDVGWSGTTQEAFELAVKPMMDLDVRGYYFCLADTPERLRREQSLTMSAMINGSNVSSEVLSHIYASRVAVEQFFSAPHPSVIGLGMRKGECSPVFDAGRGQADDLSSIAEDILYGIESFARHYKELATNLTLELDPVALAQPMIELISGQNDQGLSLLSRIENFDAWGSSRNHKLVLGNYLAQPINRPVL